MVIGTTRRKKKPEELFDFEPLTILHNQTYVHNDSPIPPLGHGTISAELLDLITRIVAHKPVNKADLQHSSNLDEILASPGAPNLKHKSNNDQIDATERQTVKKILFEEIKQKSQPFTIQSSEPGKIVFADPRDPHNSEKFVTYLWDGINAKWEITAGNAARAFIPNDENNQIILVNAGSSILHGNEAGIFQLRKPTVATASYEKQSLKESLNAMQMGLQASLSDKQRNIRDRLTIFAMPEDHRDDVSKLLQSFVTLTCDKSRNLAIAEFNQKVLEQFLVPLPLAAPYEENGAKYFWYQHENTPIGIQINGQGNIALLLPHNYNGPTIGIALFRDWLEGHSTDGTLHEKSGISGGTILLASLSNQMRYDSTPNPKTAHLVPTSHNIVNTLYLSSEQLGAHITKAFDAGRTLNGQPQPDRGPQASSYTKASEDKPACGPKINNYLTGPGSKNQARLFMQQNQPDLKQAIKSNDLVPRVTTPSGINFQLRCSFKETCKAFINDSIEDYEAQVYVFNFPGTSTAITSEGKHTLPGGIIIEVSKDGLARLRVTHNPSGAATTDMAANITFSGQTAKVINIGARSPTITLPQNSRFAENEGYDTVMCVEGCSGHYSKQNQNLMINQRAGVVIGRELEGLRYNS